MQFYFDNHEILFSIGIIILTIGAFWLVSFAQKKNWFTQEDVKNVEHALILVENLIGFFKIDERFAHESRTIFDACKQALEYTENVMNVTDDESKKKIVFDAVVQSLNKLNIEVDDSRKNLINVGIEFTLLKLRDKSN